MTEASIFLVCSNCDARLCEVPVVGDAPGVRFKVRATCPFCGDFSWEREVAGLTGVMGISTPNPIDPDRGDVDSTRVVDTDFLPPEAPGEPERVLFHCMKDHPDAQPVR